MKYRIILTEQSEVDIMGIYEYIAFTLKEPEIASKQLLRIENAILTLDKQPMRFSIYEKEPWNRRGLRWIL